MNTQTTTHDPKTCAPSATHSADINALRATLKKRVAEKQAADEAIEKRNVLAEKMSLDVCKAVVEACDGILPGVDFQDTHYGYLITYKNSKSVDVFTTRNQEAHTAVTVSIAPAAPTRHNRISYHDVHSCAIAVLKIIVE